ncbi:DNA-directed RNA polymerase subunit K [Candidatus Micrarchaeota archaeon]|nr:DNA-directed RNA polymerase subunit K [Candidatus Micrarchaeota archaeon]
MQLSKYEEARIIGARALQLSMGAPPLVKVKDQTATFIDIAEQELEKGVVPLTVLRVKGIGA